MSRRPAGGGRRGTLLGVAMVTALLAVAGRAEGQSLLDRPPNMGGTWTGPPGTVHFHFMHRFQASDPPARKVANTPTFLLSASLPAHLMAGARYATNSVLAPGFVNEWEFFARFNPLGQNRGAPLDVAVHAGYNNAADSFDGELALARTIGPLRLLAAGRGFTNFARTDESRWAIAGGATLRLHRWIALAGDVASVVGDSDDALDAEDEETAWSAGLHLQVPFTPHTLSLHYSNVNTNTLEGASMGVSDGRWGFEFTIPFTLSRYFGGRGGQTQTDPDAPAAAGGDMVEVTMSNQLTFEPRTLRIRTGQTVVWRNTSEVIHTVTADPALAANRSNVALPEGAATFNSGDMAPGATFRHTFTVPGEYRYVCLPHEVAGGMIGTVIVE